MRKWAAVCFGLGLAIALLAALGLFERQARRWPRASCGSDDGGTASNHHVDAHRGVLGIRAVTGGGRTGDGAPGTRARQPEARMAPRGPSKSGLGVRRHRRRRARAALPSA